MPRTNAERLPAEMAHKGIAAPTPAQVSAAANLNHPLNLAGAWIDRGALYVSTHDPITDGARCRFVITPDGATYNADPTTGRAVGDPLPVVGIGPYRNHPITLMADYVAAIPGADVVHTGGGCMALEVEREPWDALGFGVSVADEGALPGDTMGAGWSDEGVAMTFGVNPSYGYSDAAGNGPAETWEGVYHGCTIAPDPTRPGGWPDPARVDEIVAAFGDAIAAGIAKAGGEVDGFDAALSIAARACRAVTATFPEVQQY